MELRTYLSFPRVVVASLALIQLSERSERSWLSNEFAMYICDRLQENRAQRGTLRKIFFHLQSCRRPDIELSEFYRRSLNCSHYNRPNRSLRRLETIHF